MSAVTNEVAGISTNGALLDGVDKPRSTWRRLRRNEAFTATVAYALVGIAWILGSDYLLKLLAAGDAEALYRLQQMKGVLFILLTATGLGWLLHRMRARRLRREATVRQLEEMLSVAQKFEALGTLAGTITHDFNNMLALIRLTADAAQAETDPVRLKQSLAQIEQASVSAQRSVQQLVLFMHNARAEQHECNLADIVAGAEELLRQAAGRRVCLRLVRPDSLPLATCDKAQVEQALINLVTNARDAMQHQRSPEIRIIVHAVRLTEYRSPFMSAPRTGQFVVVTVEDNGPGIQPEDRIRVFAPFYTTKPKGQGTGLGLASVWRIVEQHEGWVELGAARSGGASFRMFFPARD